MKAPKKNKKFISVFSLWISSAIVGSVYWLLNGRFPALEIAIGLSTLMAIVAVFVESIVSTIGKQRLLFFIWILFL